MQTLTVTIIDSTQQTRHCQTQHQRKADFACTHVDAWLFFCLDTFGSLLLAALGVDLSCLPFVLAPWSHQLGHAVDFDSHILYFPCAVCCACLAAQLGCHCVIL